MTITTLERRALNAADYSDGVRRGDSGFYRIGDPTLNALIERGLLEQFPHPVAGYPLYRTTDAGKAVLREPKMPKSARLRPKLKMLPPTLKAADLRSVKPLKR